MSSAKHNESPNIEDKQGTDINVNDHVYTKIRGGRREGDVDNIVTTPEEAKKENAKHPPKVIFNDQHGHRVAHNPETLTVTDQDKK